MACAIAVVTAARLPVLGLISSWSSAFTPLRLRPLCRFRQSLCCLRALPFPVPRLATPKTEPLWSGLFRFEPRRSPDSIDCNRFWCAGGDRRTGKLGREVLHVPLHLSG